MAKRKKEDRHQPLCDAVLHNDMDSFNALLLNGENVDCIDYNETTPLILAAFYGRCEMAAKLIEKGANLNARDAYGNTPLSHACSRIWHNGVDIINLLIAAGADIDAKNNNGISPRMIAERIADFPFIEGLN